ncbi:ATP-grasp domain-containing protein [Desulfonatronospira sp. MSAO_Bac3]|uniref:ATP-grasp domain-containing protein n=1 Tax=Desulfonatronospira sp. MSAO_Bac3 TaxID=2293857 RepID=UPI000FF84D18|nr:ATP-grasp domain-containing protein [Desulfonatronospira sp. MSAO_Bac3]RQD74303.1 MAG: ATP-grasp domain-containing protein [Desulfonatronospira sp. MSAO_Bac3]
MTKKNIFIVGLDEFNKKLLQQLPQAAECEFHAALDISDIRNVQSYDMQHLIDKAVGRMESFEGSVDGVATYYDFPGTVLVPILARRFGLPGPDLESVLRCEHKYWSRQEQKEVIHENIPMFQPFDPFDEQGFEKLRLLPPFWIKPIKSFKSFLSFRINDELEYWEATNKIRKSIALIDEPFRYLLQNYAQVPYEIAHMHESCLAESPIGGLQCTLEGYSFKGEIVGYGIVDSVQEKISSSFARYQYPSILPLEIQHRIMDTARKAIARIGMDNSAFNIEFFYDQTAQQVYLLEINPRVSQAHTDLFAKVHGHSHLSVMVDLCLGRKPRILERNGPFSVAGHFMLRTFEDGRVVQVPAQEQLEKVREKFPGTQMKILVRQGDRLSELLALQDSYSYELANIIIGGMDGSNLLEKYNKVLDILSFKIDKEEYIAEI